MKAAAFLFMFICCLDVSSQSKLGNVWITGTTKSALLDFNGGHLVVKEITAAPVYKSSGTSLCDGEGRLRYYANGCAIWNEHHEMIPGSDAVNEGYFHDLECPEINYLHQVQIILPYPGRSEHYILFHTLLVNDPQLPFYLYCSEFVRLPDGRDSMLYTNKLLNDIGYLSDNISAVQHGNGRDWWIVNRKSIENTFYWYLLTPYDISLHHTQAIGKWWSQRSGAGQMAFSPDGSRCAIAVPLQDVDVFRVDRCQGLLYDWHHVVCDVDSIEDFASGVNFSPSSRFMYVTTGFSMYQFDMSVKNWEETQTLVTYYDGFMGPFPALLHQLKSAPDNKMYFTATNGIPWLGVIHQPDSVGLACHVEQHGISLPSSVGYYVPNIPYFNSGVSPDCDSLWLPNHQEHNTLYPGPNPTIGETTVFIQGWEPQKSGTLLLTNALGQILFNEPISSAYMTLSLHHVPSGTYFCYAKVGDVRYKPCKIIVAR